jgi:hypothetical protein
VWQQLGAHLCQFSASFTDSLLRGKLADVTLSANVKEYG